jgi:hypothetical protein
MLWLSRNGQVVAGNVSGFISTRPLTYKYKEIRWHKLDETSLHAMLLRMMGL